MLLKSQIRALIVNALMLVASTVCSTLLLQHYVVAALCAHFKPHVGYVKLVQLFYITTVHLSQSVV